jgi:hypothetical protein
MIEDAALRRQAAAMLQRGQFPTAVAYALDLDPQAVQKLRRRLGLARLPRGRPPGAYAGQYARKVPHLVGRVEPLYDGAMLTPEDTARLDLWLDIHCAGWRAEFRRSLPVGG